MADEAQEQKSIFINFETRGPQIIKYIDLYDEGTFGADQLSYRGSYCTLDSLKEAINNVLKNAKPLAKNPDENNILAFNRYNSGRAHHYRYARTGETHLNRAACIVLFRVYIHFADHVVPLDFGVKWAKYRNKDGSLNKFFPLGNYTEDSTITMEDLRLVNRWGITIYDANVFLRAIGLPNPVDMDITNLGGEVTDDQLDYVEKYDVPRDEIITEYKDSEGQSHVLFYGNDILTVTKPEEITD